LHRQGLAAASPAGQEVDADGEKEERLPAVAQHQAAAALGQRVEQVARQKHHAKEQHAFVHHAGKAPQARRGGGYGLGWIGHGDADETRKPPIIAENTGADGPPGAPGGTAKAARWGRPGEPAEQDQLAVRIVWCTRPSGALKKPATFW